MTTRKADWSLKHFVGSASGQLWYRQNLHHALGHDREEEVTSLATVEIRFAEYHCTLSAGPRRQK